MTRSRTLLLAALPCAIALCALPSNAETPKTEAVKKLEKDVEKLKKAAEREARSSSAEGCKELLTETRAACADAVALNLKVSCKKNLMALKASAKQARGELFNTEGKGPPGSNVKAANAACRVHLRSLRRQRTKAEPKAVAADKAPAGCKQAGDILRTCLAPMAEGKEMTKGCDQLMSVVGMWEFSPSMKNQPHAKKCETVLGVYARMNGGKK